MKTNFTLKNTKKILLILSLLFSVITFMSCSVVESIPSTQSNTTKFSRKDRSVKVYPDLVKRIMHIKNVDESPLDFFVFDLEGTLIRHFKMDEGDHKKIIGLEKGLYVYQVFAGDEISESGKITIK